MPTRRRDGELFERVSKSYLDQELIEQGKQRRDDGMSKVAARGKVFLSSMRSWAVGYAIRHGRVTANDVRKHAERIGVEPEHKNVWGSVFKDPRFVALGYESSSVPSRNAGVIRIWGLK